MKYHKINLKLCKKNDLSNFGNNNDTVFSNKLDIIFKNYDLLTEIIWKISIILFCASLKQLPLSEFKRIWYCNHLYDRILSDHVLTYKHIKLPIQYQDIKKN